MPNTTKKAFTLIELSIVLVIIGLIVGGVLVGQDLILAAKVRKEGSAIEKYNTAINTFRLKYNCLPGDCATATNFLPAAAATYTACTSITTPNVGDETCNGNGDGKIYGFNGSDPNLNHSVFESVRAWQQLDSLGLIEGKYTGVLSPLTAEAKVNMPSSRINDAASIFIISGERLSVSGGWGFGNFYPTLKGYEHLYLIGTNTRYSSGVLVSGNYGGQGPAFTTIIAKMLDDKFDDGKTSTGLITTPPNDNWNSGINCSTTYYTSTFVGQYNISYTADIACPVYWKTQF